MNNLLKFLGAIGCVTRSRRIFLRKGKFAAIFYFSLVFLLVGRHPDALGGESNFASASLTLYDASSGSYFELYKNEGVSWSSANNLAQRKSYKGRRGRLAVVRTRETHEFIRKNFQFSFKGGLGAWIGLRYMCKNRKLYWVTGESLDRTSDFQAWDRKWYLNEGTICTRSGSYMTVYYTTYTENNTLYRPGLWRASSPSKGANFLIVEYPNK